MVFRYFQPHDLFVLFPALICIGISIVCYVRKNMVPAVVFLALGALGLRIFMAHLDPFLWDWDERYHAMVAKNMLMHPLKPTLYEDTVLPYDYTNWTANHIWVHKQPQALWQMTLSYLVFGVNQFAARIPMAIEGTLMVLIIYRCGTLMMNKNAGFLSALIYTVSFYALSFVTGGEATDHVDFALTFYISASLWAWLEYSRENQWKWIALPGIFAGLAVLSKWTIGMLVFPVWGLALLTDPAARRQLSKWLDLLQALIISIMVFLPWQIYSYLHFPKETGYEMHYNQSHLLKEVDGRGETRWYYLEQLAHNYGPLVPYIILFALIFLWRYTKRRDHKIFIFSALLIPYFVFSVIAATKMPAYCYIACLPVMLALGSFAWYCEQYIQGKQWPFRKLLLGSALLLLAWFSINLPGVAKVHTGYNPDNVYRVNKVAFSDKFRKVKGTIPSDYIIFGVPQGWEIEMMYYTGNTCYPNIPDAEKYAQLKVKNVKMAIVDNDKTPDYMRSDPEVLKIKI
jgi:4-amino-4-deoxy-L-arabinose transferase-like glycosyltransferase